MFENKGSRRILTLKTKMQLLSWNRYVQIIVNLEWNFQQKMYPAAIITSSVLEKISIELVNYTSGHKIYIQSLTLLKVQHCRIESNNNINDTNLARVQFFTGPPHTQIYFKFNVHILLIIKRRSFELSSKIMLNTDSCKNSCC